MTLVQELLILLQDVIIASAFTLASTPALQYIYDNNHVGKLFGVDVDKHKEKSNKKKKEFKETTFWQSFGSGISKGGTLFGTMRVLQILLDLLTPRRTDLNSEDNENVLFQRIFAIQFSMAIAIAWILSEIKTKFMKQFVLHKDPRRLALMNLYDKLLDFILIAITGAFVIDSFDFDLGVGIQSIVTASGFSALFLGITSRGIFEQLVGGFVLNVYDVFEEGENIQLNDGTAGKVLRIGIVETEIKQWDNIVITIPNAKLMNESIKNLSKVKQSQIKQTIRYPYKDISKVKDVLKSMTDEIINVVVDTKDNKDDSSPSSSSELLITDGSKPFRILVNDYKSDHVEIILNCHLNIPPATQQYFDVRQDILLAIATAMDKHSVSFALPTYNVADNGSNTVTHSNVVTD